ncbi:MAG TPA: fused MFS/spermidine synthase [Bryobacteraceae bacterium]|nr:fused MFS/spermidine synthase [Bryobacteraceae bacterium]
MDFRRPLYIGTVFLSSTLLFLLQPIVARQLLPAFGGSAGVWTTCMLFFQAVLLLGYLYAHLTSRRLRPQTQALVHSILLAASLYLLHRGSPVPPEAAGGGQPLLRILALLQVSVGLPYFMLSTTGPLIQAWYSRSVSAPYPYRLFAVSNAASLIGLLSYPFVFERFLTVNSQIYGWAGGYLFFCLLCIGSAWAAARSANGGPVQAGLRQVPLTAALLWLALAACPSVLWLAAANHLSQSVAAIPFVWVLPLSIYLLSFVLCFESNRSYNPAVFRWLLPLAWAGMCFTLIAEGFATHFEWILTISLVSLWILCMFCHGELARRKPGAEHLTAFYLWVALGGVVGSVFVAVIAPLAFRQFLELPIGVVASALLGLALCWRFARKTVLRTALTCAAALVAAVSLGPGSYRVEARNFYGALRVTEEGSGADAVRALYHGSILHGVQWLAPERRMISTAYFAPESGIGRLLSNPRPEPMRVGVIGLGIGTLAAYARSEDVYRFYEINPLVADIARQHFTFLADCHGRAAVIIGDGRVSMEREPVSNYDVFVVDAFSGDSIPVHLLTREAMGVYLRHLKPDGVIALHITNKHLDLAPVIHSLAAWARKDSMVVRSAADPNRRVSAAEWVIIGRPAWTETLLASLASGRQTRPVRLWTDDFNNIFQVLK